MQENYGKPDGDSVQKIKAVYNDLGLEQRFFDYEQVGICASAPVTDPRTGCACTPCIIYPQGCSTPASTVATCGSEFIVWLCAGQLREADAADQRPVQPAAGRLHAAAWQDLQAEKVTFASENTRNARRSRAKRRAAACSTIVDELQTEVGHIAICTEFCFTS